MPTMEIRITNYVSIDPDYVWWNRYANAPILYNVDTGAAPALPGSGLGSLVRPGGLPPGAWFSPPW